MVRFQGVDLLEPDGSLHPSNLERLEAWAWRIQEWEIIGAGQTYFILHLPNNAHSPELARIFSQVCPWAPKLPTFDTEQSEQEDGRQESFL